jgi:hypothetical protein
MLRARVDAAVANAEIAVKKIALEVETLKSQTALSGSIISAALNSMNTSTSFGYKGGVNVSNLRQKALHIGYSYSGSTEDMNNNLTKI